MARSTTTGSRPSIGRSPLRSSVKGTVRSCRPVVAEPRITRLRRSLSSLNELIGSPREHDLVRLLEGADDLDDVVPRLFDILEADRAEQVDLLGQVAGSPLRQVAHDLALDLGGGALEGEGQVLGVDLAEHQLHGPVVELDDVLEDEHPAADLVGQLRVRDLQLV